MLRYSLNNDHQNRVQCTTWIPGGMATVYQAIGESSVVLSDEVVCGLFFLLPQSLQTWKALLSKSSKSKLEESEEPHEQMSSNTFLSAGSHNAATRVPRPSSLWYDPSHPNTHKHIYTYLAPFHWILKNSHHASNNHELTETRKICVCCFLLLFVLGAMFTESSTMELAHILKCLNYGKQLLSADCWSYYL